VLVGVCLGIAAVIVWLHRPGTVTVSSVDPGVRIEVRHDGRLVDTFTVGEGLELRLRPGPYEFRIAGREDHPQFRVEPERFHLPGGGHVEVKIIQAEQPRPFRRPPGWRPGKFKNKGGGLTRAAPPPAAAS